ncbi:MAG: peptidylprolyl isomerase [Planctomycetota bacterium]|nr:peptidylprolyl isomerase [Planctomycetota bacterium]
MPRAAARHILVKTEKEAQDLKAKIDGGADFGAMAKQHSLCPSGKAGGDLGVFGRGEMVPEFETVVFGPIGLNETSAPVKTQFGYHLIQVTKRVS